MTAFITILIVAIVIYLLVKKNGNQNQEIENSKRQKERKDLVNISSETEDNTITINLNEEELLRRIEDGSFGKEDYSDEKSIEDIVGFYGKKQFSRNKSFCVVYSDGLYENDKWEKGHFAVLNGENLLFKKRLERPNNCYVSDNGISICCDWLNIDNLEGKFIVFDQRGKQIFSKKITANLGSSGISDDGKIAIFETYNSGTEDSNQIFIVNIEQGKIFSKFDRPSSFIETQIDTEKGLIKLIDNRKFIFEVDYSGNQTNREEYDAQILNKGSIYDKLWFYSEKPDEKKLQDNNYLDILYKATKDEDSKYSFGLDRIYRKIGEYYEANNDIEKTIEYWKKAIEINPKVGVKRKLDKIKNKK